MRWAEREHPGLSDEFSACLNPIRPGKASSLKLAAQPDVFVAASYPRASNQPAAPHLRRLCGQPCHSSFGCVGAGLQALGAQPVLVINQGQHRQQDCGHCEGQQWGADGVKALSTKLVCNNTWSLAQAQWAAPACTCFGLEMHTMGSDRRPSPMQSSALFAPEDRPVAAPIKNMTMIW